MNLRKINLESGMMFSIVSTPNCNVIAPTFYVLVVVGNVQHQFQHAMMHKYVVFSYAHMHSGLKP